MWKNQEESWSEVTEDTQWLVPAEYCNKGWDNLSKREHSKGSPMFPSCTRAGLLESLEELKTYNASVKLSEVLLEILTKRELLLKKKVIITSPPRLFAAQEVLLNDSIQTAVLYLTYH